MENYFLSRIIAAAQRERSMLMDYYRSNKELIDGYIKDLYDKYDDKFKFHDMNGKTLDASMLTDVTLLSMQLPYLYFNVQFKNANNEVYFMQFVVSFNELELIKSKKRDEEAR